MLSEIASRSSLFGQPSHFHQKFFSSSTKTWLIVNAKHLQKKKKKTKHPLEYHFLFQPTSRLDKQKQKSFSKWNSLAWNNNKKQLNFGQTWNLPTNHPHCSNSKNHPSLEAPPPSWIKSNSDGSMFKSLLGAGGCLRDTNGNWISGFSKYVGIWSILQAEL